MSTQILIKKMPTQIKKKKKIQIPNPLAQLFTALSSITALN
jgi:hypothetical protein